MPERKDYKKWLVVLIHTLAWVLVFMLPELLKPDRDPVQDQEVWDRNKRGFEIMGYIYRILWVGFFYLHSHVLLPRLAFRKQWGRYLASILAIILFWSSFGQLYFQFVLEGFQDKPFKLKNALVFSTIPTIFLMVVSTTYRLILDRIHTDQREKDRMNENLKTELSLLRSQVSPHFMFNVLNNMVALARKKSDLLEPSLIKLSQLMRYMLYETEDRVSLQREVEYLENYIDLQKQRFGNAVRITTVVKDLDIPHEIEPMLLIPFVENAFKHGVGMIEDPYIDIQMYLADGKLHFKVENRFVENSAEVKDSASGIGLNNVRRRLNLLYPQKHTLNIDSANGIFNVYLQIDLA
jgi:sensor histidine kinase YesM